MKTLVGTLPLAASLVLLAISCQHGSGEPESVTQVWAWGTNTYGQLGDGTTTDRAAPVQLSGLADVRSIRAGTYSTFALGRDGSVWQWGSQRLPHPTNILQPPLQSSTPVEVKSSQPTQGAPLPDVVSIFAAANYAFARTESGAILGWGGGEYGQLDRVSHQARPLSGDPGSVLAIAGGLQHSLALRSGPPHITVWVWGYGNIGVPRDTSCNVPITGGAGGTLSVSCRKMPMQMPGLEDVIAIAAGERHSVAVKDDGSVWSWGDNDWNQLGIRDDLPGYVDPSSGTPQQVWSVPGTVPYTPSPLVGIRQVAAGTLHNLALDSQGRVWSWGQSTYGQLGQEFSNSLASPVLAPGGSGFLGDVVAIAAGDRHSLAITGDGSVYAWGFNEESQLGVATPKQCTSIFDANPFACSRTPVRVATLTGVTQVAAGARHSVVLVSGSP